MKQGGKKAAGSGRKMRTRTDYETQMIKTLTEKKRNDGTPYSPQSINTYVTNLYKLSTQILDQPITDLKWLYEPHKIIHHITTFKKGGGNIDPTDKEQLKLGYSVSTKLAFYQALITCLNTENTEEDVLQPYWEERDKLVAVKKGFQASKDVEHDTAQGNMCKKVKQNITPEDIKNMINEMLGKCWVDGEIVNRKLFMIATLLHLHTIFPWRNDLADVKFITDKLYKQKVEEGTDKDYNWLVKRKGGYFFVLNKFKTNKQRGTIIGEVDDDAVRKHLKSWILWGGKDGESVEVDTHLFTWDDGRPITRNNISVLLSNETKKYLKTNEGEPVSVSTTSLVKIFNQMPDNYSDMTADDIKKNTKLAALRGHSLMTRFTIYKNS
tara:strand:+ start:3258 stop:4400 length:1143 start_codon:yes stop_codon:yes gene_type:complete